MYLNVSHPSICLVNELKQIIFPVILQGKKHYLGGFLQMCISDQLFSAMVLLVCCSVYILDERDSTAAYIWLKLNWGQHMN